MEPEQENDITNKKSILKFNMERIEELIEKNLDELDNILITVRKVRDNLLRLLHELDDNGLTNGDVNGQLPYDRQGGHQSQNEDHYIF